MIIGDVLLLNTFNWVQINNKGLMEPFMQWTVEHKGNISFVSLDDPWKKAQETTFGVKICQAIILNREITNNFVDILGFKAWLIGDKVHIGPDPIEEPPKTLKDILLEAIELVPLEDRKRVMDLRLADILNPSEKTFGLPKMTVLTDVARIVCPCCGSAGSLRVQDGNLICTACHHDWGDIDYLPDPM